MTIYSNLKNLLYEIDIFNNVIDINNIENIGKFKIIIDNFYSLYSLEFSNLINIENKKEIIKQFSEIQNEIVSEKIFEDIYLKQIISNLENSGVKRANIKQFLLNISNYYNDTILQSKISNVSEFKQIFLKSYHEIMISINDTNSSFLSLKKISPKLEEVFYKYYESHRDDLTSNETDFLTWLKNAFFGQIKYVVGNAMFFPLVLLYMFLHRTYVSKILRNKFKQFKRFIF